METWAAWKVLRLNASEVPCPRAAMLKPRCYFVDRTASVDFR
jgi:hypothetical protein